MRGRRSLMRSSRISAIAVAMAQELDELKIFFGGLRKDIAKWQLWKWLVEERGTAVPFDIHMLVFL